MQKKDNGFMENKMSFSMIVPTYCEAENIPDLVKRIASVDFGRRFFEVILVDDGSEDGTVDIVKALHIEYPWLKLIVRQGKRGLSRSVIDGFQAATYPILMIMDADLSHPPERIPDMLAQLEKPDVDMVVGSRYIKGGSIDEVWPIHRKFISTLSAYLARLILSGRVKDPLSGFIGIRKERYLSGDPANAIGWKIGLELMVKCHCKNIVEIPIIFSERKLGKSKLNMKIGFDYLKQIKQLFIYKYFEHV